MGWGCQIKEAIESFRIQLLFCFPMPINAFFIAFTAETLGGFNFGRFFLRAISWQEYVRLL